MMCLCNDLVICNILISHGVEDITNNHGLNVVEQHVEPHRDDGDGEAVTDEENRFVFQGVADGDSGDGKSTVGEDHSPPSQVEIDSP